MVRVIGSWEQLTGHKEKLMLTVLQCTCHILTSMVLGIKREIKWKNDLKGKKNCFKEVAGLSYQGFEPPRV